MKFILINSLILSIVILLFSFHNAFSQINSISKVWVADNRDGGYKNPILHADNSDLDAIRICNAGTHSPIFQTLRIRLLSVCRSRGSRRF